MIQFLTEKPVSIKAISEVEFTGNCQPSLQFCSHKNLKSPAHYLTLTIIHDQISQTPSNCLKTLICTAEMPVILRPAKTTSLSPIHNASPKSPSLQETREQFKRDNVLHYLNTLQVGEDHCLSVFLEHPTVLPPVGATAAAKK